jgi:hypothetical protein
VEEKLMKYGGKAEEVIKDVCEYPPPIAYV